MQAVMGVFGFGVVGAVFGLAFVTLIVVVSVLTYAGVRGVRDSLLGWHDLWCPVTDKPMRVRFVRVLGQDGKTRQWSVARCSQFGAKPPRCVRACVSAAG